ncbi:18348_t:CDS:2, partial [Funneliformis geosporum]
MLESDIKEIRESRGKIPNASKKMAEKFHIGARRVYEIWNNKVSSISLPATEIPRKNGRKKKVKIDEKLVIGTTSMVEKNNKNGVVSDNSSDTSQEDRAESLLKNLVNRGEKLK